MLRRIGVLLLVGASLGCSSESTSADAGPPTPTGPPCDATPTFKEVLAKPLSSCSGLEPPCHNAAAGYLHIDPKDASATYHALVNVPASIARAGDRVVPYDPDASFLYRKLTDDLGPKEEDAMPQSGGMLAGGAMWSELPKSQLEMVRCWIRGGAAED